MEHDPGDIAAAALFTAASNMFAFMVGALKIALTQERQGGFTEDGRQIEPPVAHLVRPALDAFIAAHPTVGQSNLTPEEAEIAHRHYSAHMERLRQQVLDAIREFET